MITYLPEKVEEEKLEAILEAGQIAPTVNNFQPQGMIVVQDAEGLEKVARSANIFSAPLVIIVCAEHGSGWIRSRGNREVLDIDATIVTDHMLQQANSLGLSGVWITAFGSKQLRRDFYIPDGWEPVNILAMGYTREKSQEEHLPGEPAAIPEQL